MGHSERKCVFEHAQNVPIQIYPTHTLGIILPFAQYKCIVVSMILLADSEGQDQTVDSHMLEDTF